MATTKTKSTPKLITAGHNKVSWRRLIILASITLNIGFIVIWVGLAATHSLDGLFMADGLQRYCSDSNDDKFKESEESVKALRNYVCRTDGSEPYFDDGLNKYFDSKGLPHSTRE